MWLHSELADKAFGSLQELKKLIDTIEVAFGGNQKLKIYCWNTINRVFFQSSAEAVNAGYRPCGHCMKPEYLQWKKEYIIK